MSKPSSCPGSLRDRPGRLRIERTNGLTGTECRISVRMDPAPIAGTGQAALLLPQFACRPERTSLLAGLAGSAGPATASPTFFPGSVSLAFLARQEARLWPSSAVLRPFAHPSRAGATGTPGRVRDLPPPAGSTACRGRIGRHRIT